MKEQWNIRYASEKYIYGLKPNEFLKSYLISLSPGKILLPGDGEGRNAVFAAKLGWNVTAFDYSESAKEKALLLAKNNAVEIQYFTSEVESFQSNEKFDVISIIYLHLNEDTRVPFHNRLKQFLNQDGIVILECFSKKQINNNTGGPKSLDLLYSIEDIKNDFKDYKIELLEEKNIILDEGELHQGNADIIRLIARKN